MSGLFGHSTHAAQNSILKGLRAQTSIYGGVIPLIYGRARVPGNILDYRDFKALKQKAQGGKGGLFGGGGKGGGTTYTYQAAVMIALGTGAMTALYNVYDSAGQMTLNTTTETYTVGSPFTKTVAHAGATTFYGDFGVTRGDAYSVGPFTDFGSPGPVTLSGTQQTPMVLVLSGPAAGQYSVSATGTYTFAAADAGKVMTIVYAWSTPYVASPGSTPPIVLANLTFFNGAESQAAWGYMTTNHPSQARGYTGLAYVASPAMNLGSSGALPNLTFEVGGLLPFGGGIVDSNPQAVIYDLLTNLLYGLSFPPEEIGDLSNYSAYCIANGLFMSPVFDSDQPANQWIKPILDATNSEGFMSGGLLKIAPYGDTTIVGNGVTYSPNTTPIYDLNDDDFVYASGTDPVRIERPTLADVFNNVKVEYEQRANHYNSEVVEEFDQNAIETNRLRQTSPTAMHFYKATGPAQAAANILLKRQVYIRRLYHFTLDRRYILLDPMDMVTLNDANLGLTKTPVRLRYFQEDGNGNLTWIAEEFPWGTAHATQYPKQIGTPFVPGSNADPGSVNVPVLFEALSRMNDQIGHAVWMGISGADPNWGGCTIWASVDGATYKAVGNIFTGARMGLLTSALASHADPDTTDSFAVDLTQSFGQLASGVAADADNFRTLCYVGNTENLLLFSEQFDNAAWVKAANGAGSNPIVTANSVVAPDGATTADKIAFPAAGAGFPEVFQTISIATAGTQFTLSVWLRTDTTGPCTLLLSDYNGATATQSFSVVLNLTSSWQRFSIAGTFGGSSNAAVTAVLQTTPGTAALNVYAWGAQLEHSGGPGGYQVTAASAAIAAAELTSYQIATLGAIYNYTLGTRLRRGVFGSTIAAHSFAAQFLRLDENVFAFDFDTTLIGMTMHFKFTSFNLVGNMEQSLAGVTDYTYKVTGNSLGLLTPAHATYRPTTNPLTAHDAGASATINIASFAMRIPGISDITENSGSITGLGYNTLYYVYFDDPGFLGGAVTYNATTTKENALLVAGRFFVGSIYTPQATAPDTVGNDDGGSGAQNGMVTKLAFSTLGVTSTTGNGTVVNPILAIDGDLTTFCGMGATGNGANNTASATFSGPAGVRPAFRSLNLKIVYSLVNTITGAGATGVLVRCRFLYLGAFAGTAFSFTARGIGTGLTTLSVPLGLDINLSQIAVLFECACGTTDTGGALTLQINEIYAEGVQ